MRTVYISNRGDDKNEGTIDKPVYSWKRAKEVQGGNDNITVRFLDKASAIRCKKEADPYDFVADAEWYVGFATSASPVRA